MKLETFPEIIADLSKKKPKREVHLLLGNGFSMAYDCDIFSYNALHDFVGKLGNKLLASLFEIAGTKNFEIVMKQLQTFQLLVKALGLDPSLGEKIEEARNLMRESLITAVNKMHPEHVFKITEDESQACANFLKTFLETDGHIFSTNYDLLLYWVLMRNRELASCDGFGRDSDYYDEFIPEDEVEWSELRWGKNRDRQVIHHLHGALPLFDTGIHIEKEQYEPGHFIMDKITSRLDQGSYPIFVTAGDGRDKLEQIKHNPYLTYCFDALSSITGSLVTFGFNFGEYDEHIIAAINMAAKNGKKAPPKLWSIYIGVYSDENKRHIESIEKKFKCKVHIFDAKTAPVWR